MLQLTMSIGKMENCDCLPSAQTIEQGRDEWWLDLQQKILKYFVESNKNKEPWWLHGASPHGDRVPDEYC
jgi:hypothetical protein